MGPIRPSSRAPAPLRGIKRDLYEGGIRVPFIARWPGKIRAGTTCDHVSAFWDFFPTCAELLGHGPLEGTDGISFLPALLGEMERQEKHEFLYWEFHEHGGKQSVLLEGRWKGIRLKAIKDPESPVALYDLSKDIHEDHDVAEEHPDIVKRIRKIMKAQHRPSEAFPWPGDAGGK